MGYQALDSPMGSGVEPELITDNRCSGQPFYVQMKFGAKVQRPFFHLLFVDAEQTTEHGRAPHRVMIIVHHKFGAGRLGEIKSETVECSFDLLGACRGGKVLEQRNNLPETLEIEFCAGRQKKAQFSTAPAIHPLEQVKYLFQAGKGLFGVLPE